MEQRALTSSEQELLDLAKAASLKAYAPYSGYKVGSALRCEDGSVFLGANIENASYSLTICAERNAIFRAVLEGHQDIREIAIYVDVDQPFPPCGACRQVMAEFNPKMKVIFANRNETIISDLGALLPGHFSLEKV
ncbi:MAG TPA: cytidine deaminase [Candidatus Cloacimonadota bacterium]|nr:cytidine deaminase [Candidatus Cloacimonadota bacterium]